MEKYLLSEIYRKKASFIYKYLIKIGASPEDAQDIVQNTFSKAIEYMIHLEEKNISRKMELKLICIGQEIVLRKDGRRIMKDKNVDKDNKDFDEIFMNDGDELIKEAKRKSNNRIISTSIAVTITVIILLVALKFQVTPFMLDKQATELSYHYSLYGANTFTNKFDLNPKLINSTATATKYKILNGVPVVVGELEIPDNIHEDLFYMSNGEIYSESGSRLMQFYPPSVSYDSYRNDLSKLESYNENDIIEVGISFDKAYSFDDIRTMIPDNLDINWAWIDTLSEKDSIDLENLESRYRIFDESEIVGFHTIERDGAEIEDPEKKFRNTLDTIQRNTRKYNNQIEKLLNKDKFQIVGIVVVGSTKDLKALVDVESIKASSFGVTLK